jgi:hypothetical protein
MLKIYSKSIAMLAAFGLRCLAGSGRPGSTNLKRQHHRSQFVGRH